MIPQKLLTTFLSITISTNTDVPSSSDTHGLQDLVHPQQVNVQTTYQGPEAHGVKPAPDHQFGVELEQQRPLIVGNRAGDISLEKHFVFPVFDPYISSTGNKY